MASTHVNKTDRPEAEKQHPSEAETPKVVPFRRPGEAEKPRPEPPNNGDDLDPGPSAA